MRREKKEKKKRKIERKQNICFRFESSNEQSIEQLTTPIGAAFTGIACNQYGDYKWSIWTTSRKKQAAMSRICSLCILKVILYATE